MNVNIFLPILHKPKKNEPPEEESWIIRALRWVLPSVLFDDLTTGKPGWARQFLKWIGPTWVAAPWRRIIQAFCLLAFFYLFFWVCWPYDAKPAADWRAWQPKQIQGDFVVRLERAGGDVAGLSPGQILYASDPHAKEGEKADLGPLEVVSAKPGVVLVKRGEKSSEDRWEELQSYRHGLWRLSEQPDRASPAWQPKQIEGEFTIRLERKGGDVAGFSPGKILYASDPAAKEGEKADFGPLEVVSAESGVVLLKKGEKFSEDKWGEMQFDLGGPWRLSDRPARQWGSWQPKRIEGEFVVRLEREGGDIAGLSAGQILYASDPAAKEEEKADLGSLEVVSAEPGVVLLKRGETFDEDKWGKMPSGLGGAWRLTERPIGEWPAHYAESLESKELVHAETFLVIDPLVAISTSIASRTWAWSLGFAALILAIGVVVPRGFCGYLCPLGTLIDIFDSLIGTRVESLRVPDDGWWVHIKYYLLVGTLFCAIGGVLVTGFVAAIPVVTRGVLFVAEPLQIGLARGWHQVPPIEAGHFVSIGLFVVVLGLGLLQPRFWCKYVCPSGAVFSVFNIFRATERKVEDTCIHCNKCVEICPFDAIKPDFTTRVTDCTLCQTCGGACPVDAIKFVDRWDQNDLKPVDDPPTNETPLGRRGFISLAIGTAASVAGAVGLTVGTKAWGAGLDGDHPVLPVRPPGSAPELEFLQLCIRCGECYKACPNNVLQPLGFEQGLEGLWTPHVVADWAGCESSCNACGKVCPTGAIRALPLAEKKVARMGLAIVNQKTCLPIAGKEACDLCIQECNAAGYKAISQMRVGTEVDDDGEPIEGSGFLAPVVEADKCVGCGLCQTRCYGNNVQSKGLLSESAIIIEAGPGKEDRMLFGSYLEKRKAEKEEREKKQGAGEKFRLEDFID